MSNMGKTPWFWFAAVCTFLLSSPCAGAAVSGASLNHKWRAHHLGPSRTLAAPPPGAFGDTSDTISNPLFRYSVGDRRVFRSYGLGIDDFEFVLLAEAVEAVGGVKCLRLKATGFAGWVGVLWVAQDRDGNVWLLRESDSDTGAITYNASGALLVMPANAAVGVKVPGWEPDADATVDAVSMTIPVMRTGMGPYAGAVRVRQDWGGGDLDYTHFAPGVGLVWDQWDDDGGANGLELQATQSAGGNGGGTMEASGSGGGGGGGCFLRALPSSGD